MDPHSSAQDVHRCDLCETAIVHSYCDFCHVNLCKPCIGDHISDGYDKHKIVQFQERRSTLIYPKCETHSQKNCKFQCKDCKNIFVCSSCMASEQHGRHKFVEVTEVFKTKKDNIIKDKQEFENHISPTYEEISRDFENQLANLDGGYEKLTTTMSKQGEQWHREIDAIINKMKTEISQIKVKHRDILQKHLNEIKQIQSLIKEALQTIRKIEKSTEVSSTIEYSSKIREFSKFPPKVQVSLPTFIPKPIDREKLYSLFGQITPLSTATEENVLSLHQPKTSVRELLDKPELFATIQTGYKELQSVTCLNEDRIWTCGETNDIKCFNMKGSLVRTFKIKSEELPNDVAVDSDGDLLYCDWTDRTVRIVKNGQIEELITLPEEWTPNSLCVTSTGDLLVTMFCDDETQSKVVRYSGSTEKQTIQFDDEGKPLYSGNDEIKYITENRNHDICVADYKAGAVVVVNQDGKLRWRYTGHPSVTKNEPFKPSGITADSQSRILTADNNHCIHILDQNGQFLRYIDNCDLKDPYGLCVDNNDNLFVCEFYKGNVKKIKYLK
ncbi:E3 ubiquitin-protein ligase TRIM36-like [Magallana gigas]|uniref:E3 ubiquitin-protein ligase TRIM36-like n=1 Tax=Magallana gigas TaxID=29159 RepID=UPI00333EE272